MQIADALHGLCTGDVDPPRPWAHMSHVGHVESVERVQGGRGESWMTLIVDGETYVIVVARMPV